ncbi:unnamed protein product [Rotaria sordida]|uniref:F-box domain-containing protein n=1 Tax=Rotaria sordida TaxID=392033 RepID=A0A815QS65_9BILA|nr:unnamed protein product [Rotaria sordida]CAF3816502.1 unnamed protein product [Rotaria sordida]
MENSWIQLNDLSDEILLIIFKKLPTTEVLYSLASVSIRFNRIAYDSVFTNHLTFLMAASDGFVYPLPNPVLDRFYLHILPEIHQSVQWLELESQSMQRILFATSYPNLYGISLYNIEAKTFISLFTGETSVMHTLRNQISALVIDISTNETQRFTRDDNEILFTHIFTMFTNLQYLNFSPSSFGHQRLSFRTQPPTIISTNLLKLHVSLNDFNDCLYLLDGSFNQLHTLYVNISFIVSTNVSVNNKKKLPTLKCFSLQCDMSGNVYDELILPLLRRMMNLEKLDLCLSVSGRKSFVDGNDLKINIINHMPRLYKFIFNIRSSSCFYNEVNLPSNKFIQETFRDFKDKEIIYYVDYFPKRRESRCHIYSYPYRLKDYYDITNNFSGGIFKCVRKVSLFDERPFEHQFFLRISQSFPLVEYLTVVNEKRQIDKRFRKTKNEVQNLLIIQYPYLKYLNLIDTCIDYHEQFLCDTKMCLPFDVNVYMNYKIVRKVTRNFRRNSTRSNCAKMGYVYLSREAKCCGSLNEFFCPKLQFPEHIQDYFPHAQIK